MRSPKRHPKEGESDWLRHGESGGRTNAFIDLPLGDEIHRAYTELLKSEAFRSLSVKAHLTLIGISENKTSTSVLRLGCCRDLAITEIAYRALRESGMRVRQLETRGIPQMRSGEVIQLRPEMAHSELARER
jgi:hypothetical protein